MTRSRAWKQQRPRPRSHDPGCSTASGSGERTGPLDAREQLRLARDTFEAIGAGCLAGRARAELLAAGGRVGRSNRPSQNELTHREAQVAQMAAEGATNVEIAGRLFVSPNTVDYHLRKVYRKLGITSRRQLRSSGFAEATSF